MAQVLLIDDDAVIRLLLKRMLEREGYQVREAADGASGLQDYLQHGADLVVTDIMLPLLNGLEVIAILRRWKDSVPVLALSGEENVGGMNVLKLAQELGADRALAKPFELDMFMGVVHTLLTPGVHGHLAPESTRNADDTFGMGVKEGLG